MTVVNVWNLVASVAAIAVTVLVVRRPSRQWRTGRAGKALSAAASLFVAFHIGPVLVPLGAVVAVARHRHNRPDHSTVPVADHYPGAR